MNSQYGKQNPRPWLTENFAERFREVFGREMSVEERAFFGLEAPQTGTEESEKSD
jgi:hypothetical protein